MQYTIIVDGRSYDLPKKTLEVVAKMDEVMKVDTNPNLTVRRKFEKLHVFLKDVVGEDNAVEMLGSANLAEIDLSELTLAVRKVIDAYEKPVADYDYEKKMSPLERIPTEKIVSLAKAAQTVSSTQVSKK